MQLFGIGIDVVEVERIKSSLDEFSAQFVKRIFTRAERDYCEGQRRPELHYAVRFAAKEAVSKAFGTGIGQQVGWLDIEVVRGATGEPRVVLHGRAADFAARHEIVEVKISLSHAKHYAAANALALLQA